MQKLCLRRGSRLVAIVAVAVAGLGVEVQAQPSDVVSIGWAVINPRSTSGPLTVSQIDGQPVDQPQAGTGVRLRTAQTVVLSYEHYWNESVSAQLALGIPPTHELQGTGTLASFGVLGEGQQLSPAVIVKWHFAAPGTRLRPFVGLGVNYTWFRRSSVTNDAFRAALYGPDATTSVSAGPSWNIVYSAGLDWPIDAHWSIGLSVAYAPLKTRITVEASNTAFGVPIQVVTDVSMRTLVGGVSLMYAF